MKEPEEFIITREQVESINHFFSIPEDSMDDADYMAQEELLKAIQSRRYDLNVIKEIVSQKRGCLTCHNPDCPVWQTADQNCWKSQKEHDDQVRAEEREKVLKIVSGVIHDIPDFNRMDVASWIRQRISEYIQEGAP